MKITIKTHFGQVTVNTENWEKIAEIRNKYAETDFYYKYDKRRKRPIVVSVNQKASTRQYLCYQTSRFFSDGVKFPDGFRILNTYLWGVFKTQGYA